MREFAECAASAVDRIRRPAGPGAGATDVVDVPTDEPPHRAGHRERGVIIKRGAFARRQLVLVAYRNASGQCVEQTYLSAVGSVAYGGLGLTGGRCQGCIICVAARDLSQLPQAVVALVTDRADTLRVTFATGVEPTVFHHDYQLGGPHLDAFNQRVFMLDPRNDTVVLSLDALRHGKVIAGENIAGLA